MDNSSRKNDGFSARWRHFHPQSTVWVQNPFDHDVEFKAADERNVQYLYKLPANKISELPGGLIATLGVKELVDQMISGTKEDVLRIWDADVRAKHEAKIIMRIKEAPIHESTSEGGEIDLGVKSMAEEKKETVKETKKEEVFVDAKPNVEPIINEAEDQLVEVD
jgi:hypothetical protein